VELPLSSFRPDAESFAMKFYLIVASGKKTGMPIPITCDLFVMGSGRMCQLRSHKEGIGLQHCALVVRENKVFVRDMNSGEPTLLNNALVPPGDEWPCHAGDRLEIGPLEFVIQFREKPLSQRDLEEWALRCLDRESERDPLIESDDIVGVRRRQNTPAQAAAQIFDLLQEKRGHVHGRLRIGREGNITMVRINDVALVDEAEIALIKKELYDHLNKSNMRVLLDFKNVKRMATAAITMIDELSTWLRPWGSTLALCRVRRELQDILPRLTLQNSITHFNDKRQALTAKW
jgi:anti-anti-sigma regulatory factor